jgi:N-acyl-L-homoserine lactone synthetase
MDNEFVEILPTSMDLLYREAVNQPPLMARKVIERIFQKMASHVVIGEGKSSLKFSIVDSAEKWQQIRKLRLDTYNSELPYMRNVINNDGIDAYDARSVVFGAWYGDQAIATVRLTAWPFEMATLLPSGTLAALVPEEQRRQTMEFTRLISKKSPSLTRVMPALIMYSGATIAMNTGCKYYIGYSKSTVSKLFNKFKCDAVPESFVIPERGEQTYQILQGEFRKDMRNVIDRRVRPKLVARALKAMV